MRSLSFFYWVLLTAAILLAYHQAVKRPPVFNFVAKIELLLHESQSFAGLQDLQDLHVDPDKVWLSRSSNDFW
jgi:hypothetical protein